MIEYFIGVDGGGSGTRVRLAHADGTELAQGHSGPSSLAHGIAEAWTAVEQAVAAAFDGAAITPPGRARMAIGLGLAGAHHRQRAASFLAHNPGYGAIALETDAQTTLLGAHGGQAGAIVAIGTGSVGEVLEADGRRREVGGWGFPAGDEAGGAWIGLRAVGHAQQVLDGRAAPGALATAVIAACGGERDAIQVWLATAGQTAYAQLAPLVLQHAAVDRHAHAILSEAGQHVALIAQALDPEGRLPLALCGGLAAPLAPYLPQPLRRRARAPAGDSAAGALQLIRRQLAWQAPARGS